MRAGVISVLLVGAAPPALAEQGRCAILLHGLARTQTSFALMEAALEAEGYRVVRPGYPSTEAPIEELVRLGLVETLTDE